jgi:uncharacterized protein
MDEERKDICLINIKDIPDEGPRVSYEDVPGLLSDMDDLTQRSPLHAKAFLQKVDGYVHVQGTIDVELGLTCHRCLEEYPFHAHSDFFYVLTAQTETQAEERELDEEDMESLSFDGVHIFLGDMFREQVMLLLPMRNLCKQDCKGLCSICGANLNKESCQCKREFLNSAFSELESLKKQFS